MAQYKNKDNRDISIIGVILGIIFLYGILALFFKKDKGEIVEEEARQNPKDFI
jgi:cbb3-type cytochrome oxidase subunit 3